MKQLFKQFSFPGGIPSHVAPETPGSIHEGGELGYSLEPRLRRRVRQPRPDRRLRRRRRRGRDRAAGHELALQQVPQPGPRRRRAADPPPQRLQDRQPDRAGPHRPRGAGAAAARLRLQALTSSRGTSRRRCTSSWRRRSTRSSPRSDGSRPTRETTGRPTRPRWPMIVLQTPKGWTGPKVVDGLPVEGTYRAHQVPLSEPAEQPRAPQDCSKSWMRSYRPEELFDETGRLVPELRELAPERRPADGGQPARQRRACSCATCGCPTSATTPSRSPSPAAS